MAASAPVLGADFEPNAAVDFMLSSCLSAMADLANLERIGREKGWFSIQQPPPSNSIIVTKAH
jgi:hypothetical protein